MKKMFSVCLILFFFGFSFSAQVKIQSVTKQDALSSPIVIFPGKGVSCNLSNPQLETSDENEKTIAKLTYPDGEVSTLTAPGSMNISVIMPSYSPAPPLVGAEIDYHEIGKGFTAIVKGKDGEKNSHLKVQFEKKSDGGQIKVQCGEREWVIPFKTDHDINYIEDYSSALSSIHDTLTNSTFFRSALDALCFELKKYAGSWEKDFRISLLQIMTTVFTNEFFDPSNIWGPFPLSSVVICTDTPIRIIISNKWVSSIVLVKGCLGIGLGPGETITIEIY